MKTVVLKVSSREDTNRRFLRAAKGVPQGYFITFASPQLLFKVLSGKRWDILGAMTGAGPLSLRELARRLHRDVKGVHSDVHMLINTGVLQKTDDGKIVFPYDAIHVDFMVKAA